MEKPTQQTGLSKRLITTIGSVIAALIVSIIILLAALTPWQKKGAVNPDATVTLPNYYMDGMVFQREKPISVKGTTDADTRLTVTLEDDEHSASATAIADNDGTFQIQLEALPAQLTPYTLTIRSGDTVLLTIDKTYIGDVFLAAGQSNMEANYHDYYANSSDAESNLGGNLTRANLPDTVNDTHIRFLVASHTASDQTNGSMKLPLRSYIDKSWLPATGDNAEYLGYLPQFFAKNLREQHPNVPVGIIQVAWNGTDITRHVSGGDIYNTHITPLQGFTIGGVLWYQGESDSFTDDLTYAYQSNLTLLINQYRAIFNDKKLPFFIVQLPRYNSGSEHWNIIQQAQAAVANTLDRVYLTVSIDTDRGTDRLIHPMGKEILAKRMAVQWGALLNDDVVPTSPQVQELTNDDDAVIVSFVRGSADELHIRIPRYSLTASVDNPSRPTTESSVDGFEAAGTDGVFHAATARIRGNTVIITCDDVSNIRQVRYYWKPDPDIDNLLYNANELPCGPFTISVPQQ